MNALLGTFNIFLHTYWTWSPTEPCWWKRCTKWRIASFVGFIVKITSICSLRSNNGALVSKIKFNYLCSLPRCRFFRYKFPKKKTDLKNREGKSKNTPTTKRRLCTFQMGKRFMDHSVKTANVSTKRHSIALDKYLNDNGAITYETAYRKFERFKVIWP